MSEEYIPMNPKPISINYYVENGRHYGYLDDFPIFEEADSQEELETSIINALKWKILDLQFIVDNHDFSYNPLETLPPQK